MGKYFGILMTLNIYIFKEILLNIKNLKISNCTKKFRTCHVLAVMFQWYTKFQIHIFYLLRDIKKRN
jgi:hypothetical protein